MPITFCNSSSSATQFVLTTGLLMKMIASVSTPCTSGGPQFAPHVHQGGLSLHLMCIRGASVSTRVHPGGPQFAPRVQQGGLSLHLYASGGPQFAPRVHQGGLSLHPVCIQGASVCSPCASGEPRPCNTACM